MAGPGELGLVLDLVAQFFFLQPGQMLSWLTVLHRGDLMPVLVLHTGDFMHILTLYPGDLMPVLVPHSGDLMPVLAREHPLIAAVQVANFGPEPLKLVPLPWGTAGCPLTCGTAVCPLTCGTAGSLLWFLLMSVPGCRLGGEMFGGKPLHVILYKLMSVPGGELSGRKLLPVML